MALTSRYSWPQRGGVPMPRRSPRRGNDDPDKGGGGAGVTEAVGTHSPENFSGGTQSPKQGWYPLP